jgi:hypothetical protein
MPLSEHDWMDDILKGMPLDTIGVNPLQTLKAIPWARHKLMLVTVVSSIGGLMAVYFTENRFIYALSVVGVAMFCSAMFFTLFGVD